MDDVIEVDASTMPSYDAKRKHVMGSAKEWLELFRATPMDLELAVVQAQRLPSYVKLIGALQDISSDKQRKHGTFFFKFRARLVGAFTVNASGQIRRARPTMHNAGWAKVKSPKPRVVLYDNGTVNAQQTLLRIYDEAFTEMLRKWPDELHG